MIISELGNELLTTSCFTDENGIDPVNRRGHSLEAIEVDESTVNYSINRNDTVGSFTFLLSGTDRTHYFTYNRIVKAICQRSLCSRFFLFGTASLFFRILSQMTFFLVLSFSALSFREGGAGGVLDNEGEEAAVLFFGLILVVLGLFLAFARSNRFMIVQFLSPLADKVSHPQ